jgi:integrase
MHPLTSGTDLLLPVIHMNDYNQLLKLLASKCNIDKNISSHVARHTFATTIWMNNGGTLDGLKGTLGHMKISTTERYGNILEEKIKKDAIKVFANQDKKRALHSDKNLFNELINDNK